LAVLAAHVDPVTLDQVRANDITDTPSQEEAGNVGCHLDASTDFTKLFGGFKDGDAGSGSGKRDGSGKAA
jgi:hypothetical protein